MPKGSVQLTKERKTEIVNACAALYKTMSYQEITIRDIAAQTSFTRTSIYNYFQTKEEIFLALLQQEYEAWSADLQALYRSHRDCSAKTFSEQLALTVSKRKCMLKLLSMNLYDIEGNSRLENLVAFKIAYAQAMEQFRDCLNKFFPQMTAADIQEFIYAFFPFLFGVYPYTTATPKQRQAMDIAQVPHADYSIYELTRSFVEKMLQ